MNYLTTVVAFCVLHNFAFGNDEDYADEDPVMNDKQWQAEVNSGSKPDMLENKHYFYPGHYKDLNRRFVPVYSYKEKPQKSKDDDAVDSLHEIIQILQSKAASKDEDSKLIPVRAPPELVLAVAKKSAKLHTAKPSKPTEEVLRNFILRSGDYWNGVWKEDIDPVTLLRTKDKQSASQKMGSVKAKVMPGSKLYDLISALQKMSPRLLYIINENNKIN